MRVLSLAIVSLTIGSLGIVNSPHSLSAESIAQLDNLENIGEVTTSVLDRLGYECDTVADVGLVCKKCSSENMLTEKCTAYICDAATKKCRKKNATLPQLPDSN
ncbi:conserved hypothetical protein [Hyella patelloides LEGE 07179]|uniref:Uncharacterized protein n=1 Tax=Hyella patelloides LEGE 07179 TaxID=945734 RepID=A0A563VVK2_9CYAN|nr:hypothetical protein [Hyella patelloides]VEP15498.1 conserved hypothetical protein [Hyella patelloides LEGE 07179]